MPVEPIAPILPPAPDAGMPPMPGAGESAAGAPLPPPGSPAAPGEVPPAFDPAAAQADLQSGLDGLKSKEAESASGQSLSEQDLTSMKDTIIQDLFALMQKAGVDPSDVNSIGNFMNQLQAQDPDLYELFDYAFNNLTNQEPTMQPPEMMPPGAPDMSGAGAPPMPPSDISAGMMPPIAPPPASPAGPKDFGNLTAAMGQ